MNLHCKSSELYFMEFKESKSSDKLPKTDNWNWGWFKLDAPRQQQRSVSTKYDAMWAVMSVSVCP